MTTTHAATTTPTTAPPRPSRSRSVRIAGWIITAAGIGHTLGSLIEAAPDHLGDWLNGHLWSQTDFTAWSDAAAGFWYSVFSFGPPMLLIGATVVSLERRGIIPPRFIAWSMAAWVAFTFVASGPSPLPVLLIASVLLLVAARRVAADGNAENGT